MTEQWVVISAPSMRAPLGEMSVFGWFGSKEECEAFIAGLAKGDFHYVAKVVIEGAK